MTIEDLVIRLFVATLVLVIHGLGLISGYYVKIGIMNEIWTVLASSTRIVYSN